jgi:hypothetical protein
MGKASIEWRALCGVVWIHPGQFVDYGSVSLGHIDFFDVGFELRIGSVQRLRNVHAVVCPDLQDFLIRQREKSSLIIEKTCGKGR